MIWSGENFQANSHFFIYAQSTLDTSPSSSSLGNKALSKTNEDDQYTCDLQPISGNVLYCCKELMNFQSVYKRMYDLVVRIFLK